MVLSLLHHCRKTSSDTKRDICTALCILQILVPAIWGRTAALVEAIEHVNEEVVHDVQDLVVVLVDGHLKVQAGELAQVPVREGLLRPAQHMQCLQ